MLPITVHARPSGLYGSSPVVNSAHHQGVDRLGEGLRAVQWSDDGVIEGMEHDRLPIYCVQWHPERMNAGFPCANGADRGDALFRFFVRQITMHASIGEL